MRANRGEAAIARYREAETKKDARNRNWGFYCNPQNLGGFTVVKYKIN